MAQSEDMGSFLKETKDIAKQYVETKIEIYRLKIVRTAAESAGYILWILVSLILVSTLFIFLGLVTAFWLSKLTGSYTNGFGLTAILILCVVGVVTIFRRKIFVNPIIRNLIDRIHSEKEK